MSLAQIRQQILGTSISKIVPRIATILAFGKSNGMYDVKFPSGHKVTGVIGATGYKVGDTVMVIPLPGSTARWTIVSQSYRSKTASTAVTVVEV